MPWLVSKELGENLRTWNPWWRDEVGPPLPEYRRWPFRRLVHLVQKGMAPATVLRGARRVGKTVLLRQVIEALLGEGIAGNLILYVPFDELPTIAEIREPILNISRWFEHEVLGESFNACARAGKPALRATEVLR